MQAALSVVLVAGATLLSRSLANLERQDFGFRSDGLIGVQVNPPPSSYSLERLDALYRDIQERLRRLPGIERTSLALYAPLTDNWGELVFVEGRPPAVSENTSSSWNRVSAGHFETVGQAVLRGRGITDADTRTTENVAVVNEAFVRRFFPSEDPLAKRFGIDLPANARTYRIVGVVRDAKYTQPVRPVRPMFFVALPQNVKYENELLEKIESRSHFIGSIILRSRLKPGELEPVLRKVLAQADPNVTVVSVRTMRDQIALVLSQQRAVATLAGLFGFVALLLAAVGLYGVTAYNVVQRTAEIGVRVALGADAGRVLRLVLRSAFQLVGVGLLLGIPLAIGAGRLLGTQLHGITEWDPVALALATAALAGCAFVAALIPGVRAASIEPMRALRTE
jgi:predicted permease